MSTYAGTKYASISGDYSTLFIGSFELLSQSTADNTSRIRLYGTFYYGGGTKVNSSYSTFTVNGVTVKSGSYGYTPGYHQLGYTEITVAHNADGTFPSTSITITANSYHMSNKSASGRITGIPTIPRASSVSSANFTLGDNPTFQITRKSSTFSHLIELYCGNDLIKRVSVPSTTTAGSIPLTTAETEALYARIPNATSLAMTVKCTTYNSSGATVGSVTSTTIRAQTSASRAGPVFDAYTYADTNAAVVAVTGNDQLLVTGQSTLQVRISTTNKATAQHGATIKKYLLSCGDATQEVAYSSSTAVTMTISQVKSGTISVAAVDSRGYQTVVQKIATLLPYSPPAVRQAQAVRQNGVGEQVSLKLSIQIQSGAIGETTNAVTAISYRYRATGGSTWVTGSTAITPGTSVNQAIAGDIAAGFTMASSYDLEITVRDVIASTTTTVQISSGIPVADMYRVGTTVGMSIGGLYDDTAGGLLQLDGVPLMDVGSNSNGRWIKFSDGTMICTKQVSYTSAISTSENGLYYGSGKNLGSYAQTFIETPVACLFAAGTSCMLDALQNAGASSIGSVRPCRGASLPAESVDVTINIIAMGRWK